MEFKLFDESDLLKCAETFIDVFNKEPWNDEWTLEKAKQYLFHFYQTPGFKGILAAEGEAIIGFIFGIHRVWWRGDEFFIHEMCVMADCQKKGVGKALLHYLIEEMKESDITNISLLTDRGIPAEEFYKKNGFEEIERLVFLSRAI
ncbi:GNAT family N-acetyltransferase [Bacillus swezeyi]|uniref:GNAT family N-acetyltransferase n=1 Tax=Bacillus swezeyi TaxID=1925020 RepID=A0A1R1RZQ5_9BACI|nr:GNAT family N-acetyltransferase [Bacillus swezeyi]MEC1261039.1 GNAT family N-acetyltransferase [Bacillus swezeyi]MED2928976.1 GNAT family N-acetyltransferase [Bacillus swezeyi]MED2964498.1 GNAT family N-acetyltransferase [Bacillus swezeyi]MED2979428.1 GNAT family N-acetyltransferase [Bacillus swezeyi]MED3072344.1 GNAT family N-acetyltransferase [Bacillus swezeyi]